MGNHTKLRNVNRGYMQLDVWQKGIDLYKLVWLLLSEIKLDFNLRSQIADAAQSVPANIAEGYSRRSIKEYIQHIYIVLGSLSELLTRIVALKEAGQISSGQYDQIDLLHYEVENKLWALLKSLESKKEEGTWIDRVTEESPEYNSQ